MKFDPKTDIAALDGKVAIVTGATRGMGYHIACHLARHGARVYIAARTETDARAAIARLEREDKDALCGTGRLIPLELDLRSLASAQAAAEEFLERETQLHILIHNAAVMAHPFELTEEGIEDTMTVNYLAPFAFTRTLIQTLVSTSRLSDVRVIMVSSIIHKLAPPGGSFLTVEEINHPLSHDGKLHSIDSKASMFRRHARSKLAMILFARELQSHFTRASSTAIALAIDPGCVKTPAALARLRGLGVFAGPIAVGIAWLFGKSPAEGAKLALWCATAPAVREQVEFRGAYVVRGKRGGVVGRVRSREAGDSLLARRLWETSDGIADAVLAQPLHPRPEDAEWYSDVESQSSEASA
ncbi:NAD(P)-binding protein [Auricularia subglabra TFB-10046 SS5]|nr:NAD(P)-binding protein [Auricularia subglabra TFB-10046 SS5]